MVSHSLTAAIRPMVRLPQQCFSLPYQRNTRFVGREVILSSLSMKLRHPELEPRVTLCGCGGVGKTQIALEYAYRNEEYYGMVFWINASERNAFLSGLQEIGAMTECISASVKLMPQQAAKMVLDWLQLQNSWLLVLDNLDDVDAIRDLPQTMNKGHILITTRNLDLKLVSADGIEIHVLDKDDAVELLRRGSEITPKEFSDLEAIQIVEELSCLPLAIEQVSAFIRNSVKTLHEFLPIYHNFRKSLFCRKPNDAYPNSVAATFLLSFEKVKRMKNGKQAAKLLQLLSFLNPRGTLIEFLRMGYNALSDELQEIIEDDKAFLDALETLEQFCLIGRTKNRLAITIHRVIQAIVKDELPVNDVRNIQAQAILLCGAAFPEFGRDPARQERHSGGHSNQVLAYRLETSDQSAPKLGGASKREGAPSRNTNAADRASLPEKVLSLSKPHGEEYSDTSTRILERKSAPARWIYVGVAEDQIAEFVKQNNGRITQIRVENASVPTFNLSMVGNTEEFKTASWWYVGLDAAMLEERADGKRLISIDPYHTPSGIRFAVVMVPNEGLYQWKYWWYYDIDAETLNTLLHQNEARLISLRPYLDGNRRVFAVIMIANTGEHQRTWHWCFEKSMEDIKAQIEKSDLRLISLVPDPVQGWAGILVERRGERWGWWIGQRPADVVARLIHDMTRPIDLCSYLINGVLLYATVELESNCPPQLSEM